MRLFMKALQSPCLCVKTYSSYVWSTQLPFDNFYNTWIRAHTFTDIHGIGAYLDKDGKVKGILW